MDFYNYQQDLSKYYSGFNNVSIRYTPPMTMHQVVVFIVVVLSMFILLLTVGVLFCFQLFYAMGNRTTIETFELEAINSLVKRKCIPDCKYPYDLGILPNLKAILGRNILLWWVPAKVGGNGTKYPVNESGTVPWPPREYYLQMKYPAGKNNAHNNDVVVDKHEMSSTDYDSLESDSDDEIPLQHHKDNLKAK